jgi:SAM-dependent methyltransferase
MTAAPETPGVVIGNHTQKYSAANPAIRWLTQRFVSRLDAMVGTIAGEHRPASTPLEVGAGEGVIAELVHRRLGSCVALDLPDAGLRQEWRDRPGPHYLHAQAERLPFRDASFDLVVCVEVLEHLQDPEAGLRELARVSSRHLLLSVPHEPFFRGSNLLTGRYVGDLGNTPGHLHHWTSAGFQRFVSQVAGIRAVASPYPWTIVWAVKA